MWLHIYCIYTALQVLQIHKTTYNIMLYSARPRVGYDNIYSGYGHNWFLSPANEPNWAFSLRNSEAAPDRRAGREYINSERGGRVCSRVTCVAVSIRRTPWCITLLRWGHRFASVHLSITRATTDVWHAASTLSSYENKSESKNVLPV